MKIGDRVGILDGSHQFVNHKGTIIEDHGDDPEFPWAFTVLVDEFPILKSGVPFYIYELELINDTI